MIAAAMEAIAASERAEALAAERRAASLRWRVRGPLRAADGRAVWQVARPLVVAVSPDDPMPPLRIDCECLSPHGAQRRADELNGDA